MPVYDHRVFRAADKWWVAEVHMSAGEATWGRVPSDVDTEDTVFFTCTSDEQLTSRLAVIPAGALNKASHASMLRVLSAAKETEKRLDMYPYNAPPAQGFKEADVFQDDERLRWLVRPAHVIRHDQGLTKMAPAVEVVCLDDSALRKEILMQEGHTYQDARAYLGDAVVGELVKAVKGLFTDVAATR